MSDQHFSDKTDLTIKERGNAGNGSNGDVMLRDSLMKDRGE
jgi:hypothetical protein